MKQLWILPIGSEAATLRLVGGKGVNLAILVQAGYPVPDGYTITTEAYRDFVQANNLQAKILDIVEAVQPDDPGSLQYASKTIRGWFSAASLSRTFGPQIKL